jgi:hypothetical protein
MATRDPRIGSDPRTGEGRELDPASQNRTPDLSQKLSNAYGTGYNDAVNNTVSLADTKNGRRVLHQAADGEPKGYRKAMAERKPNL